jgi:hypothetical protein
MLAYLFVINILAAVIAVESQYDDVFANTHRNNAHISKPAHGHNSCQKSNRNSLEIFTPAHICLSIFVKQVKLYKPFRE